MSFEEASRANIRIKLALAGKGGSGKTMGSLMIAKGLVKDMSKVGIIQTEPGRAECYLKQFPGFKVMNLQPPFTPEKYITAIEIAEKSGLLCVIIDSMSDEWQGTGGLLSDFDKQKAVAKNSFTLWNKLTPRHDAFFNKIMSSNIHILGTIRKKTETVLVDGKNRKGETIKVPKKVGVKDIQRDDGEYKWMVQLDLDQENMVKVIKDNTSLFHGRTSFKITEGIGNTIRNWCLS